MNLGLDDIYAYWSRVTRGSSCWKFRGRDFKGMRPQRVAFYIQHTVDPLTLQLRVTCGNPACVNPAHLEMVVPKLDVEQHNGHSMSAESDLFSLFSSMDETAVVRETFLRAPMGYPGGKSRSLPNLLPLLPYRDSYIEPFGGSGIVLFNRRPSDLEVYNDRYGGITCFYRCIADKKKCQELIDRLELTVHSREEFVYCRDTWENVDDDVERAARWYYMHQMSFSCKEKAFGRATYGKGQLGRKLKGGLERFEPIHNRLLNVQIENLDWRTCFTDYDTEDAVFYLDPTYLGVTRGVYVHEMLRADHVEMCERIFKLRGYVAVSGYANPETKAVYDRYDWDNYHEWHVNITMTGLAFSDTNNLGGKEDTIGRGHATEVLYVKESS